ncbi:LGFP repeat-containing protein [Corynebacterium sp. 13CS0277]|uniref:LGFP repeat-containing protein n=1 Tax=Corynebacterium sp. 13CS0277 TaxID=2071994 RepID=UPI0013048F58|nr:hypothetical protein [Corynebacterium sp. 13CS0277]
MATAVDTVAAEKVYEGNTLNTVVHGSPWTELPYDSEVLPDTEATRMLAATASRSAQGCRVIAPTPHELCGAILAKYDSVGLIKWFGLPTSGMIVNPDGVGMRVHFERASIYWHPHVGTAIVLPEAMEAWGRSGYEAGPLGYPVADAFVVGPNPGVKQLFANGTMYGNLTGVHVVRGRILDKYNEYGADQGKLGFPVSDELGVPDGIGRFNRFQGGMVYWTPRTDAHPIFGKILDVWSSQGYETSSYGYPIEDPEDRGLFILNQKFERGELSGLDNWLAPLIYDPTLEVPEDQLGREITVPFGGGYRSELDPGSIDCGGTFGAPHQSSRALKAGRHEIHAQGRNFCDPFPNSEVMLDAILRKKIGFLRWSDLENIGKTNLPTRKVGATSAKPNKAVLVSTCTPGERAEYRAFWGSSAIINGQPAFVLKPVVVTGQKNVYCAPDVSKYEGAVQ